MLGLTEDYLDRLGCDFEINSINSALKVLNVNKLFDSGCRLKEWDDARYRELIDKNKRLKSKLGRFCAAIDGSSLPTLYKDVDIDYKEDFFDLIETYNVFSHISGESFKTFLNTGVVDIWSVLTHRKIVNYYDSEIAEYMVDNNVGAEMLISHYYSISDHAQKYHFPKSLTDDDKRGIIIDYIDSEDVNTNYLSLIIQPTDDTGLRLDERTRYRALKRREERLKELFADKDGIAIGAEVCFADCDEDTIDVSNPLVPKISYSKRWVENNRDYPTLLNNLIYMFEQVDNQHRCTFVSNKNNLSVFERHIGIKGKKEYLVGAVFQQRQYIHILNLIAYDSLLQELGLDFEGIIRWFFEDYLKEEFGAKGFSFAPASKGSTMIQKCRNMLIEMDALLKQFKLYVEDGEINRELLEFSSTPITFSVVPSFIEKKYAYLQDEELIQAMNLLFSDQTMLGYTARTGSKYNTIVDLLLHENVCMDDYVYYQQSNVNYLLDKGLIEIDQNGFLRVIKEKAGVLKDFYNNEVINSAVIKNNDYLNKLISEEKVETKKTLFSKPEQDYLDFILNRRNFTNGLDLRNRYIHGTNPIEDNSKDYYMSLLIMCLLMIKINDEFCYREKENEDKGACCER